MFVFSGLLDRSLGKEGVLSDRSLRVVFDAYGYDLVLGEVTVAKNGLPRKGWNQF